MKQDIREHEIWNFSGLWGIVLCVTIFAGAVASVVHGEGQSIPWMVLGTGLLIIVGILASGFLIVQPLEGRVIQFFGMYKGTVRESGLRWTLPLTTKQRISLKLRQY